MALKKYMISTRVNGTQVKRIVEAENKAEAVELGWEMFDADDIYVTEIQENK